MKKEICEHILLFYETLYIQKKSNATSAIVNQLKKPPTSNHDSVNSEIKLSIYNNARSKYKK
jgi:hypothetical protein